MTDIIEGYLRELETRLQVDEPRKSQIVSEIRVHLLEKVAELRVEDPDRSPEDVDLAVIGEFGNPHDLALAYEPDGAVIARTTGEVVMRLSEAVGRGARAVLDRKNVEGALGLGRELGARTGEVIDRVSRWTRSGMPRTADAFGKATRGAGRVLGRAARTTFRVLGIVLAVVLALTLVGGVWAYYEVVPVVEKNVEYPLANLRLDCGDAGCTDGPTRHVFYVHGNAQEVRFRAYVSSPANATGSVVVSILNPSGDAMYNRTFSPASGSSVHENLVWRPIIGDWVLVSRSEGFAGRLDVDVDARGVPRGSFSLT